MADSMYDRQSQKESALSAQQSRSQARKDKILQNQELVTKTDVDEELQGKSNTQKFNVCKVQLQIQKIKYNKKICTFSIKTGNSRTNKPWKELYNCLIEILNQNDVDKSGENNGDDSSVWCICRDIWIPGTTMIECGICHEWYHPSCINMTNDQFVYYQKRFWCCSMNTNMELTCFAFANEDDDSDPEWNEDNDENSLSLWIPINECICSDGEINDILSWSNDLVIQSVDRGCGIKNLGNTCFMNSVLQCLAYTPVLQQYFRHHAANDVNIQRCQRHTANQFCAWQSIIEFLPKLIDNSTNDECAPDKIFGNLRKISRQLQPGRQHDSHEFLTNLLDKLKYCHIIQHREEINEVIISHNECNNTTVIDRIFGGCFKTGFECVKCNQCCNAILAILAMRCDAMRCDAMRFSDAILLFVKLANR